MTAAGPSENGASGRAPSIDFCAVDAGLDDAVAAGCVPGLVAAVTDRHGPIYRRAAGFASIEDAESVHDGEAMRADSLSVGRSEAMRADSEAMRVDTVFRIASMTKLFTSVAVMMLHEQGKCRLDDPLAAHLEGWAQPGVLASFDAASGAYATRDSARTVTLRELLTHTSGYGYWFIEPELLRAGDGVIDYSDAPFLMHDPGARFTYGLGTDVLGRIVEPLSGLPLGRFVAERIARPLGMTATGWQPPGDAARLASLHRRAADGGLSRVAKETTGDAPHGGGGLYSTADDYLALLRLLLNEGAADDGRRLLEPVSVAAMTANQIGALFAMPPVPAYRPRSLDFAILDGTQKFGFNVAIETRPRPTGRPAGTYGWAGIFNTYFWVDVAAGFAAVLLMQVSPFCDPGCLAVCSSFEHAIYAR
jgi:CubicO group peptidase (beta-lactamase class C family)